jgi:phage terminase large subunit-like protein
MLSRTKRKIKKNSFHYSTLFSQAQIPFQLAPYESANSDEPRDKIQEFHDSHAYIRALFGGNRSGKTESGIYELLQPCLESPGEPGNQVWATTVSNEMLGRIIWPKVQKYVKSSDIQSIAWLNKGRRIPAIVYFTNGWEIHFKSYEQGREKFQGASVRRILLDEECDKAIFEECLARVLDQGGDLLITMTPLKGLTWVYEDVYQASQADPDIASWTISLLENKYISQESKDRFIAHLTPDMIARRVAGQFLRLEGAVFKEFDPNIHVIEPFPIPYYWRKIRIVDFGYAEPFVCQWIVQGQDGELYVYQEHYQNQTLLKEHARIIKEKDMQGLEEGTKNPYIETTVADHDAQGRAELEEQGIFTTAAIKDIEIGIEKVNMRFAIMPNGKAGLYIFNTCKNTIREVTRLHYQEMKENKNVPEIPVDKDNHTTDTLRYGVMYFDGAHDIMEVIAGEGERIY